MSKQELRLSACEGKQPFPHDMARKVAKRMRKSNAKSRTYRCHVCGQWHICTASKNTRGPRR